MFSLRAQFLHCLQGMYTITCGSVNSHQTHTHTHTHTHTYTHTRFISTLALFLTVPTISTAGCLLATSLCPVSKGTLCFEDLFYCQVLRQVLSECVARSAEFPTGQVCWSVTFATHTHTHTSSDIVETFHRTNLDS